jgi:hypothetical protein
MKTNSTNTNNPNYPILFFSALGLGYSVVRFITEETYSVIPLFLISLVIFSKNSIALLNENKK